MDKIKLFFSECKAELKKVVWPTTDELFSSTWVVIISVIILTAFIYLVDLVYLYTVNKFFV